MKTKAKFKNLFIVVMLCLVVSVPIFSRSINVKADTEQIPIYYLDEGFISYKSRWYLLLHKNNSEFRSNDYNSITVYNSSKAVYGTYQVNNVFDWWYNLYGEEGNEFYTLDYEALSVEAGLPNLEHYANEYYLIDMYDWSFKTQGYIVNNEIIKISIKTLTNTLIWDMTYNKNIHQMQRLASILNRYDKGLYNKAYSKGQLDGKAEAFENYDNLLPTVLGSVAMFFIGIFGSVEVFGMTLLTVFGIVGSLLLIWFVLRMVMG